MRFHADLHVHSKHSRATSRDLDLEHLAYWAGRKGIALVGTGDFVHPQWRAELKQKLVAAEPGLFRLRADLEAEIARRLPSACAGPARFMLSVEISTIYKKGERTRKIHHLIYAPDFATADRLAERLARIGNIASDGRPILGLDSRDLLEIALESGPGAYLVPAHIWTPWFAALGAQSGFDSIAECYGDLAGHIFAVETGLSSDPAMNWRVSFLDRYRLVSNSDAHSPGKLGREATTFDCDLDYHAIRAALEGARGYVGTVEFFPEEGKYHLDGHRKCGTRLTPGQTLASGGRCPVCGEPATIGVLHRIETLADRSKAETVPPANAGTVANLVPLPEIISELAATGAASRTVERGYDRALGALGPELSILQEVPVEDIARTDALLGEAITRLRAGRVIRESGYDGEYGVIRLFADNELRRLTAGRALFDLPAIRRTPMLAPAPAVATPRKEASSEEAASSRRAAAATPPPAATSAASTPAEPVASGPIDSLAGLDEDQRRAAEIVDRPLLIVAGPGSGKTRTLTHRIAHMLAGGAPACLAVTFTRRAAAEMRERLAALVPDACERVAVHTFHSLALAILREHPGAAGLARGFRLADAAERAAAMAAALDLSRIKAEAALRTISRLKRTPPAPGATADPLLTAYEQALAARDWVDFDDLVPLAVRALEAEPGLAAHYRERFGAISVDEYQDVDERQDRLLRLLAPAGSPVCVIGDPNQAIYGFRGSDASCFERFRRDYTDAAVVELRRNYRSSGTIVAASGQLIAPGEEPIGAMVRGMQERITIHTAPSERGEAEFVARSIERMIGGHSFLSLDSGRASGREGNLGFADFAVLYRTDAQAASLCEALDRAGIPYKKSAHAPLADVPAVEALLGELNAGPEPADLAAEIGAIAARLRDAGTFEAATLERAAQRLAVLARGAADRARLADAVALATDADFYDPRADRVSLLTLHAAKGLEFAVVFIVALEDGILPLRFGAADDDTAEERRLFYVGMTRAKDRLILSRALQRHWRGALRALPASGFLDAIEDELLKHHRLPALRTAEERQLRLF